MYPSTGFDRDTLPYTGDVISISRHPNMQMQEYVNTGLSIRRKKSSLSIGSQKAVFRPASALQTVLPLESGKTICRLISSRSVKKSRINRLRDFYSILKQSSASPEAALPLNRDRYTSTCCAARWQSFNYFFCISLSSLRRYLRKDSVRLIVSLSRLFFFPLSYP